ncbi:MAG: CDP-alcohol phosphatidyltransferase family protein [Alphaproteobacteria bacterium]|nr:CDP-alcohol phosphatidyltransferase family protein [Alphaproteobacteria bacterium]
MLDARLRPLIDPPLDALASRLTRVGLSANAVTVFGFLLGIAGAAAIGLNAIWIGLALILANRLLDGLDGALARRQGATDFGGYLDIVLDFIVYAAIPLGFAALSPTENALPAAFLIFSFVGTGTSFLAFAIVAAKRELSTDLRGSKSFYYLGGLTEGTETIAFFVLCCVLPEHFPVLAVIFGALCWVTTATRILAARAMFKEEG